LELGCFILNLQAFQLFFYLVHFQALIFFPTHSNNSRSFPSYYFTE